MVNRSAGVTPDELITRYPRLYHMAEADTWDSIRTNGLLSTSALLDLYEIEGTQRYAIESEHRPESIPISHPVYGTAVIRDQKPMSDGGLLRCLRDVTPKEWYETLNRRVFFWLTRERLLTLLNAKPYRNQKHCVLTIDTVLMLERHVDEITLAPLNSGCTKPYPHPRGSDTFLPLREYPYESRRKKGDYSAIVELTVDYKVPDIVDLTVKVDHMIGETVLETLFER
jgi:hypothetical protein